MAKVIRVGVVGCGEVVQVIHLPALRDLADRFAVTALCDVSRKVLAAVGSRHPEAERFTDWRDLVKSRKVDAVLVANPNVFHADVAIAAMQAGKHVLVEKPMCMTLAEADALLAAEAKAKVLAQVGFMRRYAPAFTEAVARVKALKGDIILARVHDVIGSNAFFIEGITPVVRPSDVGKRAGDALKKAAADKIEEAVGVREGPRAVAYSLLLGLGSHDTSAMREMIGMPQAVLHASQRRGGRALTATFDYGGFVCHYETAVDRIPRFDAHLEVYAPDAVIRVTYQTPYIRHQPATLTVTSKHGDAGAVAQESFPTRRDAFVIEWLAFADNIASGARPKTSIADARDDLVLFRDMVAMMA